MDCPGIESVSQTVRHCDADADVDAVAVAVGVICRYQTSLVNALPGQMR